MAAAEKSTKQQVLSNTIADIEKKFGKGSIMCLGDRTPVKIDSISTSILSLDIALGIGGIPRGRVTEIYGPESGGKCFDEDAYIQTSSGYKTTAEVFQEVGLELLTSDKDVPIEYELINGIGDTENTTHFVYNNIRALHEITTNTGFRFKRTYKHPLLAISSCGNTIWKYAGELVPGDYILRNRKENFGTSSCGIDKAYAMGLFIADGYFGPSKLELSNDDVDIKEFIETSLCDILGIDHYRKYDNNENGSFKYDFTGVKEFYRKYDISSGVAKDKFIPKWVRSLCREDLKSFLQGYMDCECYINETGLEVSSASYKLLYQVKLVLSQFDITSFLDESGVVEGYENNTYWRLIIKGQDFQKYVDQIGTRSSLRYAQIQSFINRGVSQIQTNHDSIPFINDLIWDLYYMQNSRKMKFLNKIEDLRYNKCNCTHTRLSAILSVSEDNYLKSYLTTLQDYYFEKVISNVEVPAQRTFGFSMSKTSTFVADGIVNHNTTLTLHIIAEAQRAGGLAAFIDAEHALDIIYASHLGVDIKNLLLSQPDSGEQALDIVEMLVSSNTLDIIVIDSVAALVPQSEIDGEMGDASMAVQARLMSRALRKLTSIIAKSHTAVVFINQLRQKIHTGFGGGFGPSETTTGGNALKFYASVRLDIRKMSNIKIGNDVIGSRTKVKVVKSKVAPPFKETEVDILYGRGIYALGDLVDLAVTLGIIKKAGAWYTFGEDRFQGREGLLVAVARDSVVPQILRAEILKKVETLPTVPLPETDNSGPIVGQDCDSDGVILK